MEAIYQDSLPPLPALDAQRAAAPPVRVERWPTEMPLTILVAVASALIWLLLAVTIIGFVYVAVIGVVLFFIHLAFVTHLRGSAVRLGPRQFPELYQRVVTLAGQAGIARLPEVYLLESGGSLNALATRFFRRRMVVLFTDLLEACEGDPVARDLVIGHELGHLRAGHLDWHLFMLPGRLVPFLGAAYSRACEHTCDRWGAALCGDPAGAVRGLAILAAGGKYGPHIDLAAYVAQERDLDTGWMTLGRWLDPYPPLSSRVAALAPQLTAGLAPGVNGPLLAVGILLGVFLLPVAGVGIGAAVLIPLLQSRLGAAAASTTIEPGDELAALLAQAEATEAEVAPASAVDEPAALAQVSADFDRLETMLRQWHAAEGRFPDPDQFTSAWERFGSGEYPHDPFDGAYYGYYLESPGEAVLYSSGPDGEGSTSDDLERRMTAG